VRVRVVAADGLGRQPGMCVRLRRGLHSPQSRCRRGCASGPRPRRACASRLQWSWKRAPVGVSGWATSSWERYMGHGRYLAGA
jgi:hypothetical protein